VRRSEGQWQKLETLRKKVNRITRILEKHFGIPQKKKRVDPVDVLIQTILSQNTNDQNRDLAYRRLKHRFPHWEGLLNADTRSITQAIRAGGLAKQKARRIRDILRWIERREGKLNLGFLKGMESETVKKTIGRLKGMGPKTVHCLLLFGLGRDVFPVDTHILRVGKRLGFIPGRMDAEKAHLWMGPLHPKGKSLSLHLNLIQFGRSVCKARNPKCLNCFLSEECLYA
jgi:endonuclease-3